MAHDYSNDWRAGKPSGATSWQDDWQSGKYAQQIKAAPGGSAADYDEKFAALTKSDSDVDDAAGWKTVKSLENKHEGTKAEMESLAAEWKSKGYDVRVQDLDQSHGAEWADLAVRKTDAPAPEPEKDDKPSQALTRARAYTAQKDFSDMVGETTQSKFGYNPVSGETGWTREDGKGIAANFVDQYQTRVKDPTYEVNPDQTASGELRANATGQGPITGRTTQTPENQADENDFLQNYMNKVKPSAPVGEQAQDTLGMP